MENNQKRKEYKTTVFFDDGHCIDVTVTSASMDLAKRVARYAPYLFDGTGFNPLDADASNIVAVTRTDHDILHLCRQGRHEAIFRLGQMDMQQAAVGMLTDMARSSKGTVSATLFDAAQRIRDLAVCESTEGLCNDDT